MSDQQSNNRNAIYLTIVAAIITVVIGLVFMNINVSQEANARNIEAIPRLLNRIETLEAESNRYREYYLQMQGEIALNRAEIKAMRSQQDLLIQDYITFEQRVYNYITKDQNS